MVTTLQLPVLPVRLDNFQHPIQVHNVIERPLPPILHEMESTGIMLDREKLQVVGAEIERLIGEVELGELANINYRSSVQLSSLLYDKLRLPVLGKTPGGKPSTDEKTLRKLKGRVHTSVELDALLELRGLEKLKGTYVDSLLRRTLDGKFLHFTINQMGTETGRMSAEDPNTQNIPAHTHLGDMIRDSFIAEDGMELVVADYSQIELRVMAVYAQEPYLLNAFMRDEDVHQAVTDMLGVGSRHIGKTLNFGVGYGMEAYALAGRMGVSVAEARRFLQMYWERLQALRRWIRGEKEWVVRYGWVSTMFGQYNYYEVGENEGENGAQLRSAVNMKVQGSAAGIMKMLLPHAYRIAHQYGGSPLFPVHDEILMKVREGKGEEAAQELADVGSRIVDLGIPMPMSVGVGHSWKEGKK